MRGDLDIIDEFLTQIFDEQTSSNETAMFCKVRQALHMPRDKMEMIVERIDQEALNRFSLTLVEATVRRLEFQLNHYTMQQSKMCVQLFHAFATNSMRFRDTVRRVHSIHAWLSMLRSAIQMEVILPDVLNCMHSVIKEINISFSTEYAYWKRFIPEILELHSMCNKRFQPNPLLEQIMQLFFSLLRYDFSFLAYAHSQLGRKEFNYLIEITELISHRNEIEYGNLCFCRQLHQQLSTQEWPDGTGHQERRRVHSLISNLQKVWNNRVDRVDNSILSSSDESVGEDDEEEDEQEGQQMDEFEEVDNALSDDQNQEVDPLAAEQFPQNQQQNTHNSEFEQQQQQQQNETPIKQQQQINNHHQQHSQKIKLTRQRPPSINMDTPSDNPENIDDNEDDIGHEQQQIQQPEEGAANRKRAATVDAVVVRREIEEEDEDEIAPMAEQKHLRRQQKQDNNNVTTTGGRHSFEEIVHNGNGGTEQHAVVPRI